MTATLVGVILEVAPLPRRPRHKKLSDPDALGAIVRAQKDLQGLRIEGHEVLGVVSTYEEPEKACWVGHFGHSINCWPERERSDHTRPAPSACRVDEKNVRRLFGYTLVLEGEVDHRKLHGTYVVNPGARILISSVGAHRGGKRVDAEVARDREAWGGNPWGHEEETA